jgi:uncharacterized protein
VTEVHRAGGLPALAARLVAACRDAGLPVGPDRAERFARAVVAVEPATTVRLRHCALASLVSDPAQIPLLDRVLALVFGGLADPAEQRGEMTEPGPPPVNPSPTPPGRAAAGGGAARTGTPGRGATGRRREMPAPAVAAGAEQLGSRDFDALTAAELARLSGAMRALRVATPPRRTRRTRVAAHGDRVDLRATLRAARDTGGDPVRLARRRVRRRPRRLVVLCDI